MIGGVYAGSISVERKNCQHQICRLIGAAYKNPCFVSDVERIPFNTEISYCYSISAEITEGIKKGQILSLVLPAH